MVEPPGDRHWQLRVVGYVRRRPEEPERSIIGTKPRKQEDGASLLHVTPVATAGLALGARDGLGLPVDERSVDGVIAVTRRRRKAPVGLVEREREEVCAGIGHPTNARLPWSDLGAFANTESGQDLDACVSGVHLQRHVRT